MSSNALRVPRPPTFATDAISVSYGALRALDGLGWTVSTGEILGIIGPNGAGKSSCFAAITNCVPHEGRTFLDGEAVSNLPTHALAARGVRRTFQQNSFFGDLSVRENAMAVLEADYATPLWHAVSRPWRLRQRQQRAQTAASALLSEFGIASEHHAKRPSEIPYGAQRMLSIALAYADGAKVLLLDEPAAGMGGNDMGHLARLLLRLREQGLALVVIEHHMDLIMSIADRIIVIDAGRLLAEGSPAMIKSDPKVIEAYLGRTE